MGDHPAMVAVVLVGSWSCGVQLGGLLKLGDRISLAVGDLHGGRPRQVVVSRPRKDELATDLDDIVLVLTFYCVLGCDDGCSRRVAIAQAC